MVGPNSNYSYRQVAVQYKYELKLLIKKLNSKYLMKKDKD